MLSHVGNSECSHECGLAGSPDRIGWHVCTRAAFTAKCWKWLVLLFCDMAQRNAVFRVSLMKARLID